MAEIQTPASAGHDLAVTGRVAGPTGLPSDARAAIELADVAREFRFRGEVITAVRGIDLAISEGEFFSMLGPSGCGKTHHDADDRRLRGAHPRRGVAGRPGRHRRPGEQARRKPWWRTTVTTSCPVPAAQDVLLHMGRLGRPQRGGIAQ
jgi:ABC-type hemin transport system ATPase subunit